MNRAEDVDESVATRYSGTTFRSRLEARYAVFFDAAGIDWQYEPAPPLVIPRSRRRGDSFLYLADFHLPTRNSYCDVKGFLYQDGLARLLAVTRALRSLTVLGHLPSAWESRWPCTLILHRKEVIAIPWNFPQTLYRAVREENITPRLLIEGFPITIPEWAEEPLKEAKYHRFPKTAGPIHPRPTYKAS
jgi:hypothetical protein